MVSGKAIPFLVGGMLLTGISNSLFTKWQDMQCVENCGPNDDPRDRVEFSQPVWQTLQMFVGECLCLLPIMYSYIAASIRERNRRGKGITDHIKAAAQTQRGEETAPLIDGGDTENANAASSVANGNSHGQDVERGRQMPAGSQETAEQPTDADEGSLSLTGSAPFLFFAPAACDICGTTLMNVGLLFTPVSIYQMTRGALVLWVGIFSVIFLRRHLYLFQWLSLVTVMLGVCIVGLSGTILKESDPQSIASTIVTRATSRVSARNGIFGSKDGDEEDIPEVITALLGVLLILFAQLFTASQFVLEEKIMSRYDVEPLLAVGYEGLFGLGTTLIAMPLLHFFYGSTAAGEGGYFDMRTGWRQTINSPAVLWSSVAIAISIALFNGCGLAVTRAISATARSTIDTCRTLGIWVASLLLGWEVLRPLSGTLQTLGFALLVYGTLVFNGIVKPPKAVRPAPRRPHYPRHGSRSRSRPGMSRSRSRATGAAAAEQDPAAKRHRSQRPGGSSRTASHRGPPAQPQQQTGSAATAPEPTPSAGPLTSSLID